MFKSIFSKFSQSKPLSFQQYYQHIKRLRQEDKYAEIAHIYGQTSYRAWRAYKKEPEFKTVNDWVNWSYARMGKKPFQPYGLLARLALIAALSVYTFDISIELDLFPETPPEGSKFSDVIGIDEYKEELQEIVDYLRNPAKYTQSGARLPKGILLVGLPGTGKTLLARSLASEAGCTFISKAGSEFDEMFVGVGAARVRKLFEQARKQQPCIIFIDEIDSIGGKRSEDSSSRGTINQILTEMDGFNQNEAIIVIGATNMEQSLDQAITRAGRFDKVIHIMPPDVRGRQQLFEHYLKKIKHSEVDTSYLARKSIGLTGADIQNIVNIAILNAIKSQRTIADSTDFDYALDRTRMGIGRKITGHDIMLTAYHEGGHALTSLLTAHSVPLDKVTILPRGGALGYTSLVPKDDQLSQSKANILAQIDVAMGGRAAEDLRFGQDNITSGCGDDLAKATEMAYAYVKQLGMGNDLIADGVTSKRYDFQSDKQVQELLSKSYERVKGLLEQNIDVLHRFAQELEKNETMSAEQLRKLM